jgi:Tc toxin complex TcA C-terminal TcB-binding domain
MPLNKFSSTADSAKIASARLTPGYYFVSSPPKYRLHSHEHSAVDAMVDLFNRGSIKGLMEVDTAAATISGQATAFYDENYYKTRYSLSDHLTTTSNIIDGWPTKHLELNLATEPYAVYNWELFFHVPMTIAIHLSKNQRFAQAQRWFHFVFDPTDASLEEAPQRYWKFAPFKTEPVTHIQAMLEDLSDGSLSNAAKEALLVSIREWSRAPFRPHRVAALRPGAYQLKAVMAYIDNLVAWGDSLFRQDTGEAVDEAMMLYVQAANILGPRPQSVPQTTPRLPQTYASLRYRLDAFGNAMTELETQNAYDIGVATIDLNDQAGQLSMLRGIGSLYFCVPGNEKLVAYWDTVGDRLFKIRNSLNLKGAFRRLALFDPPIDSALLARGVAAGLSVGDIMSGLTMPLPLVRYQVLAQKASELCQETKALGNALLSSMEKIDSETFQLIRLKHEKTLVELGEMIRYGQLQESIKAREGIELSLKLAIERFAFYQRQLGKNLSDIVQSIPNLDEFSESELESFSLNTQEPEIISQEINISVAQDLSNSDGYPVSSREREEIRLRANVSDLRIYSAVAGTLYTAFAEFPGVSGNMQPFGTGVSVYTNLPKIAQSMMAWWDMKAVIASDEAQTVANLASLERRKAEWTFQSNGASGEISQIFKQLRAAQIREALAEHELKTHRKQIEQAKEIERFMNAEGTIATGKATNKSLYNWMKAQTTALHAQAYELAFDTAKKAERALQHELGDTSLQFIAPHDLAGRNGLVAGDKLHMDLRRMDLAYLELNQREYELTKHISLLQLNPLALIMLKATGQCQISIPETLFDMDGPGHFFRRIRGAALSIPCILGPYTSINCRLTLQKSQIRKQSALLNGKYEEDTTNDPRFDTYFGQFDNVVTSAAQSDSGLFDAGGRDERYLPFEGAGVISEWTLSLPSMQEEGIAETVPAQFDYNTISDVILHLRYTAREGGKDLRKACINTISTALTNSTFARALSLRYEFPNEWAKITDLAMPMDGSVTLTLRKEHFPFWWQQARANFVLDQIAYFGDSGPPTLTVQLGTEETLTFTKQTEALNVAAQKLWIYNLAAPQSSDGTHSFSLNSASPIKINWFGQNAQDFVVIFKLSSPNT